MTFSASVPATTAPVWAAGEQVRMVLELTKLNRILRPYDTVDEALEGL